jgi:hypothetical protein
VCDAVLELDERLGRRADDHAGSKLTVVEIRRRIEQAQRAIRLERIEVALAREPHGQHELVYIARGNVFLGARDVVEEFLLVEAGLRGAEVRLPRRTGQTPRKARTTSRRNESRSWFVPACSNAARRVRWSNTSSERGAK